MLKHRTILDPSRILVLILLLLLGGISVFVALQIKTDRVKNFLETEQPFVFLVVADNKTAEGKRIPLFNEIIMYHPLSKKIAMIDIPAETGSLIHSLGRVDSLSVLYRSQDMKEYLKKLEELLGLAIPFYLILSVEHIETQVDLLSGIEIFIPRPLENSQNDPMVLLPSGNHLLDGSKVKIYLLHQDKDETETNRTNRYQRFIQSWLRELGENKTFLLKDDVFSYFYQNIKTNMEDIGLKTFLTIASSSDWERVTFQQTLGIERQVDQRKLLFPHSNGTLLRDTIQQVLENLANNDSENSQGTSPRLEILNGTQQVGLAARTAQFFKSFGYNVLTFKNASSNAFEETTIINRKENLEQAQKIADLIQCKKINSSPTTKDLLEESADITIILGKDFDGRYVR